MNKIIAITVVLLNVIFAQGQEKKLWWDKDENGKFGVVVMPTREVVVKYQYDDLKFLKSGYNTDYVRNGGFKMKLNGKWGVIDKSGKEVVAPKFDEINFFTEGLVKATLNGKSCLINMEGKEVAALKFDEITFFSQSSDWIETRLNGKYGFMKINGKGEIREIFAPKYDEYFYYGGESFPSGFVNVKLGNKWGLVDEGTCKEITKMKYDEVSNGFYNSSLAEVKLNNKWGFIDKTGKEVVPCKYDATDGFYDSENKAKVTLAGRSFYINKFGKEVK